MKFLIFSFLLFLSPFVFSQQGDGGVPKTYKVKQDIKKIHTYTFEEPNIEALKQEDEEIDHTGTAPWRFGFNNTTNLNLSNSGTWITFPNGDRIWQLVLKCKNARTINLTFSNTEIPEGNELYVFNPSKDFILGKFTAYHTYNGELGTELIPGETAIVEYFVPNESDLGNVNICTVTHGYRTSNEFLNKAFGGSGSCNVNVNCPDGAAWIQQRNSVVMLVSGSNGFCTGALINNVLNNGKPYVLSANHCYSNPASWIFRFQWQSANCTNPATSPTFQSLSGAVLRARSSPSDFCLVEITGGLISGTVPAAYTPYFSGWDNTESIATSTVCIHHPSGDIKKISKDNTPVISTNFNGSPANSHWGVQSWDSGVTEGGSSGSPLYNQNKRIIGQLHGGASACGASDLSDEYGKVSVSWNPTGSTSSGQLKYWLDPNNTNANFIDGYDPTNTQVIVLDAGLSNSTLTQTSLCGSNYIPKITISNGGTQALTSAIVSYSIDGGATQVYNWNGNLAQFQTQIITLPAVQLLPGNHTFLATVSQVNNGTDEVSGNNSITLEIIVLPENQTSNLLKVEFKTDNYAEETYMELISSTGTVVWFEGNESVAGNFGTGNGNAPNDPTSPLVDNTTYNWDVPLLLNDCYTFKIYDYYGDGLEGFFIDGSLSLANNNNINFFTLNPVDFGAELEVVVKNVGNAEIIENTSDKLVIYPNPANDLLVVDVGFDADEMSILDIYGKLISTHLIINQHNELNISSLASGTYWIKVDLTNGTTALKRFIKQ